MPSSLSDFLWDSKQSSKPSSLVIGNPAGDADSIISALCWAYVASTTTAAAAAAAASAIDTSKDVPSSTPRTMMTPILSISRHDLQSQRPETMHLLQWANIAVDSLLDVDNVRQDPSRFESASVTLVDHNRLDASLESLHWAVTGVLDHHYDEGLYTECALREIAFAENQATVASTATLVAEQWLRAIDASSSLSRPLASDVAILLLGTILLDSVNMQPSAGKGTPRDQAVLDALLTRTNWQDGKWAAETDETLYDVSNGKQPIPTRIFERLQQAKFNVQFWKGLSVRDALRLDYKEFTPTLRHNDADGTTSPFGASTVLLDWDTFVTKQDVSSGITAYMNDVNISFLAIMCTFTAPDSNALQRQLVLCAKYPVLLNSMVDYLQGLDAENNLHLNERKDASVTIDGLQMRVFDQGKSKASRKQVAPLLISYFETCSE